MNSLPSLCPLGSVEMLQHPSNRIDHVAKIPFLYIEEARRQGDTRFHVILNIQLPGPPHYTLTTYIPIPDDLPQPMKGLVEAFIKNDDSFRNNRLKLIPKVIDGSWLLKKSVGNQPTLIGNHVHTVHHRGEDYLEIDYDVNVNSFAAMGKLLFLIF
jgi:hypothetical protein